MLQIKNAVWRYRKFWWLKHQSFEKIEARMARLLTRLLLLCVLHVVAMMLFEGLSLGNSIWLTLTTATTVGYGDISAVTTAGRVATILFMYLAGIFLLAQVAGEFIDMRLDRRQRMITGRWRWSKMRDHILIINLPKFGSERYLDRFTEQMRQTPGLEHTPIQILTDQYPDGLPSGLRERGVVHRNIKAIESTDVLASVNVDTARCIFVLAEDANDAKSDSVSLDILLRLESSNYSGHLVVEAVLDTNKTRFKQLGANSVLRPLRAYPELLVRSLVAPCSEIILEDLFTHGGVRPERVDVIVQGRWIEIVYSLMQLDVGLPMAYLDTKGEVVANPSSHNEVDAKALLIMVNEDQILDHSKIIETLSKKS